MDEKQALSTWIAGDDLSREEIESLFGRLMDGELSDVYKAALFAALTAKGETIDEITGAAQAMRSRVIRIPHGLTGVVDTCGTGGDQKGTFNISTAAAFVAAAAGVPIAKHGNRSVSSRSGSADVLESLGVPLSADPQVVGRTLEEVGIAFLFAPALHPAMAEIMPVRRELGIRTVFNLLGPLTNPAGAQRQVVGVYSRDRVEALAEVLKQLGAEHVLVVHGEDGLDEITTTDSTLVAELSDGQVEIGHLEPEGFGLKRAQPEDLAGGEPSENAAALRRVLEGEEGPLADITAFNAGAAVYVGGVEQTLEAGVSRAVSVLQSGAGWKKLTDLRDFAG
jgi:anthranilate phosphoribosyltransferase